MVFPTFIKQKKIERGKIRFDKTIAKLQKERSKLEKTERALKQNEVKKGLEAERLESINEKAQKLQNYQELYDSNQRLIYLGKKIQDLGDKFQQNKRKRELLTELFKLVQIENSKKKNSQQTKTSATQSRKPPAKRGRSKSGKNPKGKTSRQSKSGPSAPKTQT